MAEQMIQHKEGEKVATQAIPTGYKQTEVGIIPEDWEVNQLGDLCSLKSGLGITAKEIDDSSEYRCFGGNGLRGYTKKHTHEGDYALIGRQGALCGNIQFVSGKFFASEHALVASPTKSVNTRWLSIYLERMNLNQYSESSAQPGLSAEKLRILKLITPTSEEQATIAKVLSDTAVLITGLEQLIAKKQAIKTATMQQLLTGRTRLSQFALRPDGTPKGYKTSELGQIPEDWEAISLSALCDVRDGTHDSPKYQENGIPLVTSKNIVEDTLDLSQVSLISVEDALEINKRSKVDKGDIIMSMIGTVGSAVLLIDEPLFCIKNVALFKPRRALGSYLVQVIRSQQFQKNLEDSMDGGIQKFVSLGTLRSMEIVLPSSDEQTAIAAILSDMDSELTALEQKLAKARSLKQGMMQQLLTGRIRLPVEQVE